MGSTHHEKSFVDFEQPYEQNVIGLKGIFIFGIGLLALIVITFFLMWALLNVLEDDALETKSSTNPMLMSERDRLPPEPRLQSAPGFGVTSESGPVNLELREPQAEYRELQKQWDQLWRVGLKDKSTGAVTAVPIEEAKDLVLQQNLKARTGPEAEEALRNSHMLINDASSGRAEGLKRR